MNIKAQVSVELIGLTKILAISLSLIVNNIYYIFKGAVIKFAFFILMIFIKIKYFNPEWIQGNYNNKLKIKCGLDFCVIQMKGGEDRAWKVQYPKLWNLILQNGSSEKKLYEKYITSIFN